MTDELNVDVPDSTTEDQEPKTVAERKQDLLDERLQRLTGDDESTEEDEEVEVETPEADESETEETDDSTDEDVLSQADEIDIESLSEQDIRDIAELKGIDLEPKGNQKWAANRRELKEARAERDAAIAAKDEILAVQNTNSSDADLKQAEANIKHWNRQLALSSETQYDEASGSDVKGVTHDGKFYTADAVFKFIDEQEGKLPDLRSKAAEAEAARGKVGNLDEVIDGVREKLNLDGDTLETFDKLLSNPKFDVVKNLVPDFAVELVELLGLASLQKSGSAKKKVTIKRRAPKESKDSSSPKGSTGRPSPSKGSGNTEIKRLEKVVNDSSAPIKQRRDAQLKIRHLKLQ
jgi:hypothetical protein